MLICNGSPLASNAAGFDDGGGGGGGKGFSKGGKTFTRGDEVFRNSTPESSLILLVILDFLDNSTGVTNSSIIEQFVSGLTLAFDSND